MLFHRSTFPKPGRRLAAALAAVTLGVGLLAGCGSDTEDGTSDKAPRPHPEPFP